MQVVSQTEHLHSVCTEFGFSRYTLPSGAPAAAVGATTTVFPCPPASSEEPSVGGWLGGGCEVPATTYTSFGAIRCHNEGESDGVVPAKVYHYEYTAQWGSCSLICGGGTRSRPVSCKDATGMTVNDALCGALTKPPTTAACNVQACGMVPSRPHCHLRIP